LHCDANILSTHLSLNDPLVFATKNREPIILVDWEERLSNYIGGTVRGIGGRFFFHPSHKMAKPWNHGPRGLRTVVVATAFRKITTGNINLEKWVALVSDDGSCVNDQ